MGFKATVLTVFIASPSDVTKERQILRDAIHEWNAINASARKVILLPVGWEQNVYPIMEGRAQESINKQILEDSDILIGLFWTRLGTPTDIYPSGTAEEIQKHHIRQKPTMVYFSNQPVKLDSVNQEQYDKLIQFKKWCQDSGITESFETDTELFQKINRHLSLLLNDKAKFPDIEAPDDITVFPTSQKTLHREPELNLGDSERHLLKEMSKDHGGSIYILHSAQGKVYQTNGKAYGSDGPRDARFEAETDDIIRKFESLDLATPNPKGNVFKLTGKGYRIADEIT